MAACLLLPYFCAASPVHPNISNHIPAVDCPTRQKQIVSFIRQALERTALHAQAKAGSLSRHVRGNRIHAQSCRMMAPSVACLAAWLLSENTTKHSHSCGQLSNSYASATQAIRMATAQTCITLQRGHVTDNIAFRRLHRPAIKGGYHVISTIRRA